MYTGPAITVVGLCGRAGVGKDTLAEWILAKHGFYKTPLALALKLDSLGEGRFTYEEVFHSKPPHVRTWLQDYGHGKRQENVDYWLRRLAGFWEYAAREWGINRFVVTDCRYPNEVDFIRQQGGRVLGILSDRAAPLTPEQRLHPTETAIDAALNRCDAKVWNDTEMPWSMIETQVLERLRDWSVL